MRFQGKVSKDGVLRIVNRAYFDKYLQTELADKEVTCLLYTSDAADEAYDV